MNALLLWCLISVAQMPTMRQIESHQSLVWSHQRLVDLEICWRPTQGLNIDAPFLAVQAERLQSASLACELDGVDPLVSAIVSSTRVAFGVFVGHGRPEGIEDGAGREVFAGNEDNGLALTLYLFFLCLLVR